MTDKEFNFEKTRIKRVLRKWRAAGFEWFRVTHTWERTLKDDNDTSAAADCTAKWEYKSAWIKWYLPMFVDQDDEFVERVVIHELSHILVSPTQNFSTDQDRQMTEYATQLVADALRWSANMRKK